jgi:hypothetical protein
MATRTVTPDQWRAAVSELYARDAACPWFSGHRQRALAEMTAHVHAGRYDEAVELGELMLVLLPEPPPQPSVAPWLWLDILSWLTLVATLMACFALFNR